MCQPVASHLNDTSLIVISSTIEHLLLFVSFLTSEEKLQSKASETMHVLHGNSNYNYHKKTLIQ